MKKRDNNFEREQGRVFVQEELKGGKGRGNDVSILLSKKTKGNNF